MTFEIGGIVTVGSVGAGTLTLSIPVYAWRKHEIKRGDRYMMYCNPEGRLLYRKIDGDGSCLDLCESGNRVESV